MASPNTCALLAVVSSSRLAQTNSPTAHKFTMSSGARSSLQAPAPELSKTLLPFVTLTTSLALASKFLLAAFPAALPEDEVVGAAVVDGAGAGGTQGKEEGEGEVREVGESVVVKE